MNADIVYWIKDEKNDFGWEKRMVDKYQVGKKILTKRVGYIRDDDSADDAVNITDLYKNKEGSSEERMSVLNAARQV